VKYEKKNSPQKKGKKEFWKGKEKESDTKNGFKVYLSRTTTTTTRNTKGVVEEGMETVGFCAEYRSVSVGPRS
jgi:hypothetical protein